MTRNFVLNDRQVEELAKLLLDLGKLVFGSLVLGFFQSNLEPGIVLAYGILGLGMSFVLFAIGLSIMREVKK